MDISQRKYLAGEALQTSGAHSAVWLHSCVTVFGAAAVSLIGWLLSVMAPEGGIGNLGTHSILATVPAVVMLLAVVLLPFWNAGLVNTAMQISQRNHSGYAGLTEGFRRGLPLLSTLIFRGVQYLIPVIPCAYTCYSFYLSAQDAGTLYPGVPQEMVAMTLLSYGLFYVLALVPLLGLITYRYRMVPYLLMEEPDPKGLVLLRLSIQRMKGHKRQLLKMDFRYWWFHIPDALLLVVSFLSPVLELLPVSMPFPGAQWAIPLTAAVLRLLLHLAAKPRIAVEYALFFANLPETPEPKPKKAAEPGKMPWKY